MTAPSSSSVVCSSRLLCASWEAESYDAWIKRSRTGSAGRILFGHRYATKKRGRSLERWIEETAESHDWCSFKTGPIHNPQDRFAAPPQAEAVVEHRFGAYFDRRCASE